MLITGKFSFGEYELDCDRRLLSRSGEPLNLYPKAFDLLEHLVENRGRAVSKDELLEHVWPGQFVEENNLTVQVSALRKTFGDTNSSKRFIATIPGKGYRFVADVVHGNINDQTEIVIENRSFSRIVVEGEDREFAESIDLNGLTTTTKPMPLTASNSRTRRFWPIATAGALVAVIAIVGGAYIFRASLFSGGASATPFSQHTVRQLTTTGKVGMAALSLDGNLFAYTIDNLGQKSLWLGNVDGGNHVQLRPPTDVIYRAIAFSPESSHIYYSVRDESVRDEKNPKFTLYKMPVFGGAPTKVLDDIGRFSLSPDGKTIAIGRRDDEQERDFVVIVPLDGSARRDAGSLPRFFFDTIAWSADGNRLALSTYREGRPIAHQIAVLELSTGEIKRLEHDSLREITKIRWLSDGSGLIVTAIEPQSHSSVPNYRIFHYSFPDSSLSRITTDRSSYGHSWHNDAGVTLSVSGEADRILSVEHRQTTNIWVTPADDFGAARQITHGSFGRYDGLWGLDWTPDGDLIYTTSDTESQNISRMKADGSEQKHLTASGFVDSSLTVSADGRYVVFHSNRTGGDFDIWRMNADGSNPLQLTFGGNAYQPLPSPDGRWVWFKSHVNLSGGLCRVPIDGGEPEVLDTNQTSQGSFSPDGRFFAAHYVSDKQRLAVFSTETNKVIRQFELPKTALFFGGTRWTPDSKAVAYRDVDHGYWMQPIDSSEAKRLEGLPKERLYNFSWSRDGKWLAFVRGQEIRDVVILQNQSSN